MRPVIGLSPLWDNSKESYWMLPGYMKMLEECGAVPLMLPLTHDEGILDHCLNMCNGILLTGGQDAKSFFHSLFPPKSWEITRLE